MAADRTQLLRMPDAGQLDVILEIVKERVRFAFDDPSEFMARVEENRTFLLESVGKICAIQTEMRTLKDGIKAGNDRIDAIAKECVDRLRLREITYKRFGNAVVWGFAAAR